MTKTQQIAEAFVALAKALPGVDSVVISMRVAPVRVTMWTDTNASASRLAGLLGAPIAIEPWGSDGSEAMRAEVKAGEIFVSVVGPTRKPKPLNEAKVDAALAQAADALTEAS